MDINRILRETFVTEVEHHVEINSTSDRCAQRAKQGWKKLPLLVIADNQTAGRGRGGNRWWTGTGSLAFSLLLESNAVESNKIGTAPLISLAAGLSVIETVRPLLPNQQVGIHWPNDIIAASRKLAGILVEILPDGRIIIGIGINTNNSSADAPADLAPTVATLLDLTYTRHDHTEILIKLLGHLEKHLMMLNKDSTQLTVQAHALCLQRDKKITLQIGQQTVTGLCQGIAANGALLLETSEGLRSFFSGVIISPNK
jgi:BirA family transcriptional regulator, biotin operon repressor / biotin---[acetyl-CoA-carboxylase] ligase